MGLLDETVSVPRRTMTLFFLIDTSGSMEGSKIGAVNDAVVNVLPILNDISETNPDAEIKVAALEFSSGVNWLYDEPKAASDFIWQDVSAGGLTSLGGACAELAAKLSRNGGFMQSASGSFAPAIILLSEGRITLTHNLLHFVQIHLSARFDKPTFQVINLLLLGNYLICRLKIFLYRHTFLMWKQIFANIILCGH